MKKISIIICLIVVSAICNAQVVQVKGVGTTTYQKFFNQDEKDKAYKAAQLSAVERYFAESGESESQAFEDNKEKIEANLEKFILSTSVINEEEQKNLKKYSVAVRVELNVAKLRNVIRESSAVNKSDKQEKSQIVYIFVGREVASVQSFDARVVKRAELSSKDNISNSTATTGEEGESVTKTKIATTTNKSTSVSNVQNASATSETSGGSLIRADDTSFRLLPLSNVKTSITSVFSQGGFLVAEPEFVIGDDDMKSLANDFSKGNDLAASTMRAVVSSLKQSKVPYLVLATLDVGASSVDSATGLQRVSVTVSSRVLDLTTAIPHEIASAPAIQYFGVGPDSASAINKGLKDASLAAAREVVSRLNVAGIR